MAQYVQNKKYTFQLQLPESNDNCSFKILQRSIKDYSDLDAIVRTKLSNTYGIESNFRIETLQGELIDNDSFDITDYTMCEFVIKFSSADKDSNHNGWLKNTFNAVTGMFNNGNNNDVNNSSSIYEAKMTDHVSRSLLEEQLRAKEELFNKNMIKKTLFDNDIENICYDMQIQSYISKLYPNIGKLWKYNPSGLLKFMTTKNDMSMQGILYIKATKGMDVMACDYNGRNCIWKYKNSLYNELNEMLPGQLNDKLKNEAKDIFYNKHNRAVNNKWPKINSGELQRTIELKESRIHNELIKNVSYNITWYMKGILMVSDERKRVQYGKIQHIARCKCEAVEFKVVLLNEQVCKQLNSQLNNQKTLRETKLHLDSLTDINVDDLSWDDV